MMRGQLRQAMMRGHRSDDEGPTSMEVEANVEEGIGNDSQQVAKVEEGIDRLNDSQKKKQKCKQTNDKAQWPKLKKAHLKEIDTI